MAKPRPGMGSRAPSGRGPAAAINLKRLAATLLTLILRSSFLRARLRFPHRTHVPALRRGPSFGS